MPNPALLFERVDDSVGEQVSPSEYRTEHLTAVGLENLGKFVIVADVIKLNQA